MLTKPMVCMSALFIIPLMKIIIIITRKCFSKNVHMNTITTLYYVEATFLKGLMLIRQVHLGCFYYY